MSRIALLQMTSGTHAAGNAKAIAQATAEAGKGGATMLFTPEMALVLDRDRDRAARSILSETDNPHLPPLQEAAARAGVWLSLGLPVALASGRWANRTLLIDAAGKIAARYDKIHMFDVDLADGESWRESAAFEPGRKAVTVSDTPLGTLGLATCYDVRFPALFEAFGKARCDAIAIPAAFTVFTGTAHWHVLQRARAIEASAFVIAAAQVGHHVDNRMTYGHSLVVGPWGEVLLDMGGDTPGLAFAECEPSALATARSQVPSLANKRDFDDGAQR